MKKIKSVAERQADKAKLADIKDKANKATTIAGLKTEVQRLAEMIEEHINS